MQASMLRIDGLTVMPHGVKTPICADVSFVLRPGERVALVGASGAGKTTLLRAINGSMPAHSGTVLLNGMRVDTSHPRSLRRLRRTVAMIPQKHDLVPRLHVYQNVMAGALGRWSAARALRFLLWPLAAELAEAQRALEQVALGEKLRARTATLSGGQQQRVAIARALVQQPSLILADEPIASLDPGMARQVLDLLCTFARDSGVALVCTLHQPDLAEQYFPRILTMESGRLTKDGPYRLATEAQREPGQQQDARLPPRGLMPDMKQALGT